MTQMSITSFQSETAQDVIAFQENKRVPQLLRIN